jgi:hypothetical protein
MAELKFTAQEIEAATQAIQEKYGVSLLGHPDRIAALVTDFAMAASAQVGKWCGRPGCAEKCTPTLYGCEPQPCEHDWKVTSQRALGMWCKCKKCGATKEETWD